MNFSAALAKLRAEAAADELGLGGGHPTRVSPHTLNRPVDHQPATLTDGLDPAAPGGPSPFNSGVGPYGTPVVSDPLVEAEIRPGSAIPHQQGPDVDAITLS